MTDNRVNKGQTVARKVEVLGKSGLLTTWLECRGLYLPLKMADAEERMQKVQDFRHKDGDVIVSTYPKTGTHWLGEIVFMILKGNVENMNPMTLSLDFTPNFVALNDLPSPRMFGTHFPFRLLPEEHKQKRGKLIHLLRNPKDTMVSMYYFCQKELYTQYKGTWDEFFNNFLGGKVMYGNYIDCIMEWEAAFKENPDYDILTILYEDLHKDCMKEVKRICKYLGVQRSDDLLRSIVDACKMDSVKKSVLNDPEQRKIIQSISVDKSQIFYRKGAVGDWKNHFTVAQNEVYDRILKEKLADFRFKFTYEL